MLVRVVYGASYTLARVASIVSIAFILVFGVMANVQAPNSTPLVLLGPVAFIAVGLWADTVVHEAGHLLACLALRVKVTGVRIGSGQPLRLRFTVAGIEVSLGLPGGGGQVAHAAASSAGRSALIAAAGPMANLIAAAVLFSAGRGEDLVARAPLSSAGHTPNLVVLGLALLMVRAGVVNLLPFRTRTGPFSDGVRVLALLGGPFAAPLRPRDAKGWLPLADTPAALHAEFNAMVRDPHRPLEPEQATRWLKAYWDREPLALHAVGFVGRSLRLQGRIDELLRLFADLPRPAGPHVRQLTVTAHMLDWEVLMVPGLPANVVDRAVNQVQWVLHTAEFDPAPTLWNREGVLHTLALGKLRQGHFAEAEELCRPVLAGSALSAANRTTVLATVALARGAAGLPYEAELAEARFLDPDADLVAEATGPRQFQGA